MSTAFKKAQDTVQRLEDELPELQVCVMGRLRTWHAALDGAPHKCGHPDDGTLHVHLDANEADLRH